MKKIMLNKEYKISLKVLRNMIFQPSKGGSHMAFNILRAARAVLHVTDLQASREFYVKGLGFIVTEEDNSAIYLRGLEEHCHHSLLLKKAESCCAEVMSYKVHGNEDLDGLAAFFENRGMKTKWPEKGSQHAIGRALR